MRYTSRIDWIRNLTIPFDVRSFDRTHTVHFGSGFSIDASSAPEFAGNPELPNPEELFTASIASCLMLTFLFLAAKEGYVVDQYTSEAIGTLSKNTEGKMAMTEVSIVPQVVFAETKAPSSEKLTDLFHKAHQQCFISSSVKTEVRVNPVMNK